VARNDPAARKMIFEWDRRTSSTGIRAASRFSCSDRKTGLSATVSRIHRPTRMSAALARKGMRQPQARKDSPLTVRSRMRKEPVPSTRPSGTPTCGQLP